LTEDKINSQKRGIVGWIVYPIKVVSYFITPFDIAVLIGIIIITVIFSVIHTLH